MHSPDCLSGEPGTAAGLYPAVLDQHARPLAGISVRAEWIAAASAWLERGGDDGERLEIGDHVLVAYTILGQPPMVVLVPQLSGRAIFEAAVRRFRISPRESQVLRCLLDGASIGETADALAITEFTVGDYIKRMFVKTGVRNRSEMIAKILGWVPETNGR